MRLGSCPAILAWKIDLRNPRNQYIIANDDIQLRWVSTASQLADVLSKALRRNVCEGLCVRTSNAGSMKMKRSILGEVQNARNSISRQVSKVAGIWGSF
jgi:hypothetical protein